MPARVQAQRRKWFLYDTDVIRREDRVYAVQLGGPYEGYVISAAKYPNNKRDAGWVVESARPVVQVQTMIAYSAVGDVGEPIVVRSRPLREEAQKRSAAKKRQTSAKQRRQSLSKRSASKRPTRRTRSGSKRTSVKKR